MKILVSAPYFLPVVERFRPRLEGHGLELIVAQVRERLEEEQLLPLVADVCGAICGDDRYTRRVIHAARQLRVLAKWGTGVDSIDLEACAEYGVEVRNTPNAFSDPVADTVLGYMLCFARGLPWHDAAMKRGEWQKRPGLALRECTLGVLGVGNVGRAVARRAVPFGIALLGNDPVAPPGNFLRETGMTMVDRDTLLRRSDFVSVNCDLNPTSRGLIDGQALRSMKPEAVLINTARGPIVVEADLVAELGAGTIAGAALDVFEREPLPADSPLRAMEQVMLSPHGSNASHLAWERVHENTVRNLLAGLGVTE